MRGSSQICISTVSNSASGFHLNKFVCVACIDEPRMSQSLFFLRFLLALPSTSPQVHEANKKTALRSSDQKTPFTQIGWGSCGVVCAKNGIVIKLAKSGFASDLLNDHRMHKEIKKKFEKHGIENVKVPQCYKFVEEEHFRDFAKKHSGLLAAVNSTCNIPTCAIVASRIPPLREPTRLALIDMYCPDSVKEEARNSQGNQDCLIRVYLGSMRGRLDVSTEKSGRPVPFSLRNFKLHLNQMKELRLDVEKMARRMATALAVMHWAALTDARDVEYVLGGTTPPRGAEFYILDFNQVRKISLDERGVARALEAAKRNDPYLPKPGRPSDIEQLAWLSFAGTYLEQSKQILEKENRHPETLKLPFKFLLGLNRESDSRIV